MQFPITIGLHRSRFIDAFVGLCAALASLSMLLFPVSEFLQVSVLLLIWGVATLAWRALTPRLLMVRLEREGRLSVIRQGDQEFIAVRPLPAATVHPWLTVVRLKSADSRIYPLVLSADSLSSEDFRRLRIFLRWRVDFSALDDDV